MNYYKKILFVLIAALYIFPCMLNAQDLYSIQGRIVDAGTKEPLPGASVFEGR